MAPYDQKRKGGIVRPYPFNLNRKKLQYVLWMFWSPTFFCEEMYPELSNTWMMLFEKPARVWRIFRRKMKPTQHRGQILALTRSLTHLAWKMISKMWNVINVIKWGIMPTNVQKLRPKTQRGHLKCEKWNRGTLNTLKRNPFVKFEFVFQPRLSY